MLHPWILVGSVNLAIQGLNFAPKDIDIMTTKQGAYEIERRLSEFIKEPVKFVDSGKLKSHWGKAAINGINVDIIGDFSVDGSVLHAPPFEVVMKDLGDLSVPCLSLDEEETGYRRMGRVEKADKIAEFLRKHLFKSHLPSGR